MKNLFDYYTETGETDKSEAVREYSSRMDMYCSNQYDTWLERFKSFYRDHVLGLSDNRSEIASILWNLLKQPVHPYAIVMVYVQIFIVRTWAENEVLIEVLQHIDFFNKQLVDIIVEIRPDIDTTPLLNVMELNYAVAHAWDEACQMEMEKIKTQTNPLGYLGTTKQELFN